MLLNEITNMGQGALKLVKKVDKPEELIGRILNAAYKFADCLDSACELDA